MVIERNGEGFLINMARKQADSNGKRDAGSAPAILKDGSLDYSNGPVTNTVTYVKANDSLLLSTFVGSLSFVRVK